MVPRKAQGGSGLLRTAGGPERYPLPKECKRMQRVRSLRPLHCLQNFRKPISRGQGAHRAVEFSVPPAGDDTVGCEWGKGQIGADLTEHHRNPRFGKCAEYVIQVCPEPLQHPPAVIRLEGNQTPAGDLAHQISSGLCPRLRIRKPALNHLDEPEVLQSILQRRQ